MRKIKKKYLRRLKALEVSQKDIIILEVNEYIPEDAYAKIKTCLQSIFPENKILVLENMKIGIIREKLEGHVKPPATSKPSKGGC